MTHVSESTKNTMKKIFTILPFFLICFNFMKAQDTSMLELLGDDEPTTEYITNAFKSSRVVNGQSMEMIAQGALDFRILHRFGPVSGGAYELFGLDQASMRLGFDYGITKNFTVGIGRSTARKEGDGFLKYRLLHQSKGNRKMPFSLIYVGGITCDGLEWSDTSRQNLFSSRLSYYHQLVIGRKFNNYFTLQFSPTFLHRNLVPTEFDNNDIYALGVGTRIKVTKRMAITADYFYVFNRTDLATYNPLSIGIDIETGGHVFQLHLSNSIGMNERAFISDTENQWANGEIRLGFNLSRIFQIVKK